MTPHIQKEIRNLKKLRAVAVGFIVLVILGVVGAFAYAFHTVYVGRAIAENFLLYAGPTLFSIAGMLLVATSPLFFIIYQKFRLATAELAHLTPHFAQVYEDYCAFVDRPFTAVPQYIISQKGLLLINNMGLKTLSGADYNQIKVRRANLGRAGKRCTVTFCQNSKKVAVITYLKHDTLYPGEVTFLLDYIRRNQPHIEIKDDPTVHGPKFAF